MSIATILDAAKKQLKSYFDLSNSLETQEEATNAIIEGVSFRGANIIILIFSIFIASLGLNTNSAAVIIGAMLISPLMGPIIGIGLGVGTYDFELIKRSFRNLAMAAAFSVLTSTIFFLISPVNEGRSELLARTSPTIYDVLIGFFGGAAGIVALACKQKGNVIPGVAIATALMPPLCTAGYGLATWQLSYFFGAFYLFIINSIFIAFATTVGVKFFKFKPHTFINPDQQKKIQRIVYSIVALTLLPSIWLTFLMLRESYFVNNADNFINKEFVFPNTQVISKDAGIKDGHKYIKVTLIGEKLPIDSLQAVMQAKMASDGLEGAQLEIQQGFSVSNNNMSMEQLSSTMFHDIYQSNMEKIASQTRSIDSLRAITTNANKFDSLSLVISPEVKVLFPSIQDLSLNRSVFCDISNNTIDTINIALIQFSNMMSESEKVKFKEYIEARTGLKNVQIIKSDMLLKFGAKKEAQK